MHRLESRPIPEASIDISRFRENNQLGDNHPILIQLKGFNRLDRISRALSELSENHRLGNTSETHISLGALIYISKLNNVNYIDSDNIANIQTFEDTRGICTDGNEILIGSVDQVIRIGPKQQTEVITHPDFAFIHSLSISPNKKKMLVVSSGYEKIIEIDLASGKEVWKWDAELSLTGKPRVIHETQLTKRRLGIPPGNRHYFPNSATYIDNNNYLVTLFHGGVIKVRRDLSSTKLQLDTSHPHGAKKLRHGYLITDTGNQSFLVLDEKLQLKKRFSLKNMPPIHQEKYFKPWLQFVSPITDNVFIAVDSGRATLFIVDIKSEEIRKITYNPNWVIQETTILSESQSSIFENRNKRLTNKSHFSYPAFDAA